MKDVLWVGDSKDVVRAFSEAARREIGHQLHLIQLGLGPDDFRAMPAVGAGVFELRTHEGGEYRAFYVAKFDEAVFVLHAFEKKTRKTADHDIEEGRKAYASAVEWRREQARQRRG